MDTEHLALCVECDEVHPSHHTTRPDCGCTSAIPLSRLTQGRREGEEDLLLRLYRQVKPGLRLLKEAP